MDLNALKTVYMGSYISELMEVIRKGDNLENFISKKDAKARENFLTNDFQIVECKKKVSQYHEKIQNLNFELNSLNAKIERISGIKNKIIEVVNLYPESQKSNVKRFIADYKKLGQENFAEFVKITKESISFIQKLTGKDKKIENANQKFAEFIDYCKKNNINEYDNLSIPYLNDLLDELYSAISAKIKSKDESEKELQKSVDDLQYLIDSYDSKENVSKRDYENDLIRQFVAEYSKRIINPCSINKEEIERSGLSKQYIADQILQSNKPGEVTASLRNSYEYLNRPAAPVLAFTNTMWEDVLINLREKGINAVSSDDQRASDPKVFVVDKNAIHAPFLPPKDALTANIKMIEAVYERNDKAIAYLSNPLTRESLVPAVEIKMGLPLSIYEMAKLNNSNVSEVIKGHFESIIVENQYQNLYRLIGYIQKRNPELAVKTSDEIKEELRKIKGKNTYLSEDYNIVSKIILQRHETQLAPYILDLYIATMKEKVLRDGIDTSELDENINFLGKTGKLQCIYHGSKFSNPYAIVHFDKNMYFIYGTAGCTGRAYIKLGTSNVKPDGALAHALGWSAVGAKQSGISGTRYGFLYEYEAREENQEFIDIDKAYSLNNLSDGRFNINQLINPQNKTMILPQQNKLKKMYVVAEDDKFFTKAYQLEIDENGQVTDEEWRKFCDIHKPIDDNMKGYMVERHNNMIEDYDTNGKDKIMNRSLEY